MANSNIINAVFGSGICAVTTSAFRANYGMVLRFSGIELPTAFEVDFSNYDVMGRDSITMIGQNGEVQIPDQLWDSGLNIYAYVYLHPTDDSGVTVYTVTIPVLGRPNRTEETPTPHEQSVIEQAISALNDAVEQTAADVETTTANAQAAAQSEANAATSERSAAASAGAALASQNAAESASQSATESASASAESARNAANSAAQAAESATNAQESAEQAERSVQSIGDDVERAERAATTATDKATAASGSAATASAKATEASASATAAAQSAQNSASAAQNAASSATAAESSATDAEQAKQDAQDAQEAAETAQTAAEQAAQSVSGLSEQIEQNTADIANLVLSKAGALVDTVSGSIASFTPDATIPTVRGLTVNVEPQQDLHGYDNPWPAGGGKNLLDTSSFTSGSYNSVSLTRNADGSISLSGTASSTININGTTFTLPAGTYTMSGSISNNQLYLYDQIANTVVVESSNGTSRTVTTTEDKTVYLRLRVGGGSTVSGTVKPQLESGSTATPFAPYSNICPISGWDEVEVKHSGEDMSNPTTYTITLGQTVYGGKLNVTGGKMVVDRVSKLLNDPTKWATTLSNTVNFICYEDCSNRMKTAESFSGLICSYMTVDSSQPNNTARWVGATSNNFGIKSETLTIDQIKADAADDKIMICYPLATPITIDLTPVEVAVITGQTNNIWADSGDVSVEYAADLKTYIDNKIAAAVAALS